MKVVNLELTTIQLREVSEALKKFFHVKESNLVVLSVAAVNGNGRLEIKSRCLFSGGERYDYLQKEELRFFLEEYRWTQKFSQLQATSL